MVVEEFEKWIIDWSKEIKTKKNNNRGISLTWKEWYFLKLLQIKFKIISLITFNIPQVGISDFLRVQLNIEALMCIYILNN